MLFYLLDKFVFVPNEQGELTAQDLASALPLDTAAEMPATDYGAAVTHMLLMVVAVILLLFVSVWFLRRLIQNRLQKGVGEQAIQILEKRMISPKTMLYLVEVDNKKVLLAESHLEVRKLETFPSEDSE